MLLKIDYVQSMSPSKEVANVQAANLNVPQKEMLLNIDKALKDVNFQGANLNVPQEEMLLNKTTP